MDPAPFGGIVFVAVVLEDTAALVVLQEILSETGLRHRAPFLETHSHDLSVQLHSTGS